MPFWPLSKILIKKFRLFGACGPLPNKYALVPKVPLEKNKV